MLDACCTMTAILGWDMRRQHTLRDAHLANLLVAEPQHNVETRQPSKIWNEACTTACRSAQPTATSLHAVHQWGSPIMMPCACKTPDHLCRMQTAPHSSRCPYKMRPQPACALAGCGQDRSSTRFGTTVRSATHLLSHSHLLVMTNRRVPTTSASQRTVRVSVYTVTRQPHQACLLIPAHPLAILHTWLQSLR